MRLLQRCATNGCVLLFCAYHVSAQNGGALYKKNCGLCHDASVERVPSRDTLKAMSPERVLAAMESGAMISMASRLSAPERRAVAEFVTGKSLGKALEMTPSPQAMCGPGQEKFTDPLAGPSWNGWGVNLANARYQEAPMAGITVAEVPTFETEWAFGFPGDVSAGAQPTIAGGRVFVGSQGGKVYSLSAATGCIHWWFEAPTLVRSAVSIGHIESEAWREIRCLLWRQQWRCVRSRGLNGEAVVEGEGRRSSRREDHWFPSLLPWTSLCPGLFR